MESFFNLLQKNVLNRRRWSSRTELRLAIVTWIETTYHRRRREQSLGRLTPIEFETLLNTARRPDPSTKIESTELWAVPGVPVSPGNGRGHAIVSSVVVPDASR
jgi:hypothetical protein